MERYEPIIRTYGKENFEKIQNAKLLIVGAGGIGCEVRTRPIASLYSSLTLVAPFTDFEESSVDWFQVHRADRLGYDRRFQSESSVLVPPRARWSAQSYRCRQCCEAFQPRSDRC